jgi:hypothetical protein
MRLNCKAFFADKDRQDLGDDSGSECTYGKLVLRCLMRRPSPWYRVDHFVKDLMNRVEWRFIARPPDELDDTIQILQSFRVRPSWLALYRMGDNAHLQHHKMASFDGTFLRWDESEPLRRRCLSPCAGA